MKCPNCGFELSDSTDCRWYGESDFDPYCKNKKRLKELDIDNHWFSRDDCHECSYYQNYDEHYANWTTVSKLKDVLESFRQMLRYWFEDEWRRSWR